MNDKGLSRRKNICQRDGCHVDAWNAGKQLDTNYIELLNNLNSYIPYAEYIFI